MIPLACRVDYWRNYVSYAPDVKITMMPSKDPVFVDLSSYMIQGAKVINRSEYLKYDLSDANGATIEPVIANSVGAASGMSPIPNILDKIPTERGWLLKYIQLNLPSHGTTMRSVDCKGFYYYVGVDKDYEDCFNYILTNGSQRSNIARVYISVQTPFAEGVPLDLKYHVIDGITSFLDGNTESGWSGPDSFVQAEPVIDTQVRRNNLVMTGIEYSYVITDPPSAAKNIEVYNCDGKEYVLWSTLSVTAATKATETNINTVAKMKISIPSVMPMFNGVPRFKFIVVGNQSETHSDPEDPESPLVTQLPTTVVELSPVIVYSPSKHKAAVEKALAQAASQETTNAG